MRYSLRYHASIALAFIAGACASCSVAPAPPANPPAPDIGQENIDWALHSAITLYRLDGPRRNAICSGVRVSPTRIVTAYHCVVVAMLSDPALELIESIDPMLRHTEIEGLVGYHEWFSWEHGTAPERGQVIAVDPTHDLAILSTARSIQPHARVVRGMRGVVGEDVFAIGNPLGLRYTFTRGYVSYSCRMHEEEPDICWTQTDLTVGPGNSGGGLYDSEGELMGLCSHGYLEIGLNFFADPEALSAFVEANP